MSSDRGCWCFSKQYNGDIHKTYPEIRKSLRTLMENLISSKILIPKTLDFDIHLEYKTTDELLNCIEESGYLENAAEFSFWGDTVIYTSNEERISQNVISVQGFRTSSPSFCIDVKTDHWLPMMMDKDSFDFTWNLELYKLNYHRIPDLLKKLDEELGWENKGLLNTVQEFTTVQAGYDLFIKESVIIREYKANPNPDFDLDAYLIAMKHAIDQHSQKI